MSEWKNKLESITKVPGETLDKDLAWQKLYARMDKKPKKNRTLFYWAAAAALLTAALFLFIQNQSTTIVKPSEMAGKKYEMLKPANDGQIETVKPTVTFLSGNDKKEVKQLAQKTYDKSNIVKSTLDDTVTNNLLVVDSTNLVSINDIPKVDPIIEVAAPKKKMKVVHVNELGRPREDVIMAQRQSTGRVLINNNSLTPGTPTPATQSNNIRISFYSTN